MILDRKGRKEALSSVVAFRTSTAPLDPELADQFHKHFGIPVLQNYGATEFAGGVAGWKLPDFLKSGEKRRSEEHTSELQSLMRISYAVFCLKKKKSTSIKYTQIELKDVR